MFTSIWFWLALVLMAADWIATGLKANSVRLVTKPGALAALILWFSTQGGWHGALLWFGLGLVFSLLGDIFLLRPDRAFLAGLAAFLLGHVFYIIGFNSRPFVWSPAMLLPLAGILLISFLIGQSILRGLKRGKTFSRMKAPVLAYMTAISLMVLSAWICFFRPDWSIQGATLSSLGAVSFLASDSILASDRFVRQRRWAGVALMITYHLGQVLIASGALLAFH